MSNDHIFAAQMWTWPEPMIKRDSHGRILIVNAAFLQLYGGSVENWTGNPISGWPDPQAPGQTHRFESRIPLPTGGETVYDWLECSMADGTALAMARNVSIYTQQAAPQPVQAETAQDSTPTTTPENTVTADLHDAAPVATQANPATAQAQPALTPEIDTATQDPIVENVASPEVQLPEPQLETAPAMATPAETIPAEPVQVDTASIAATPVAQAVEAPEAAADENRDFERRPLPIEDGDAILGNNWRDAVIAKAVGVEDAHDVEAEVTEQISTPSPDSAPAAQTTDGIKVLLAEDNAINALLTRTLLEAEGCHCDVVEDGALAVEAVKNTTYDMIFMDMRMPNMDGLEATRKIRAMGLDAKKLPIVALTANAFDDDRNACFDSGMNDFMTKPVSAEELSAMVESHTGLYAEKIAS